MTQKIEVSLIGYFVGIVFGLTVLTVTSQAAELQPNILWINAEDMSPHLGCYGFPHAITPNIDGLAAHPLNPLPMMKW